MKKIIMIMSLSMSMLHTNLAADDKKENTSKDEKVKVCVDVQGKDGKPILDKDGKAKQQCKEMKKHKKHEGHAVPDKK